MAPGKSHENRRENGIHLHKRQGWMAPHGCATKRGEFLYHHFFSLVKQWQRRLVHGQKMREVVQLVAFFGWGFRQSKQMTMPKHEDFRAKTELISHTQPTFFGIDLSGWTSLFSVGRGDFHTGFATPGSKFLGTFPAGETSHTAVFRCVYSFKDSSRAECHAQKWQLLLKGVLAFSEIDWFSLNFFSFTAFYYLHQPNFNFLVCQAFGRVSLGVSKVWMEILHPKKQIYQVSQWQSCFGLPNLFSFLKLLSLV